MTPDKKCQRGKLLSQQLVFNLLQSQQQKQDAYRAFSNRIDKPKALSLLLHTADISHPSKPWALHSRWTTALMEEFFRQVGTLR